MLAGVTVSYAGSKCCPSKKAAAAKAAKTAECSVEGKAGLMNPKLVEALKLTPEQKTTFAALQKKCSDKKDCDVTQKNACKEFKAILTKEQLATCEKVCKESGIKCPLPKDEKVKS